MRVWDATTGGLEHVLNGFDDTETTFDSLMSDLHISKLGESTPSSSDAAPNAYRLPRLSSADASEADSDLPKVEYQLLEGYLGWILRYDPTEDEWKRMCWLSPDRTKRDALSAYQLAVLAHWGERICVGSENGVITIVEFSPRVAVIESSAGNL
jgi:hypothetical protein